MVPRLMRAPSKLDLSSDGYTVSSAIAFGSSDEEETKFMLQTDMRNEVRPGFPPSS